MSNFDLVLRLFLQLAVILGTCRIVGVLGRYLGQTQVVSEMLAGVLLGPALFGSLAPLTQAWLFPQEAVIAVGAQTTTIPHPSMAIIYALSQLGLVLYMFLVGLELNADLLKGRMRGAGLISLTGIVVPFALGAMLSRSFVEQPDLFRPGIPEWNAAVFMGAAMSITAFPMLARIIYDKGIAGTRLGTMVLAAGAIDDAIAWCLLALVLASVNSVPWVAVLAIAGGLAYGLGMVWLGRPAFRFFARWTERDGGVTSSTLLTLLLILMASAWITDTIGIYAVFGAFLVGAVMPRGRFAVEVRGHLGLLTSTLLLPLFFVYSGLNTRVDLVNTPRLWMATALVVGLAIAGKWLACMCAARVSGESWRESATIGTLMNARGLMELVLLNIGLQAGIIRPTLFTIMVLMTVITTLMTSPLFHWFYGRHLHAKARVGAQS